MSDLDIWIDDLQRVYDESTPGQWKRRQRAIVVGKYQVGCASPEDCDLAAKSHNAMPRLLGIVRAARAYLEVWADEDSDPDAAHDNLQKALISDPSVPFSLSCAGCDAGDEIDSAEEALEKGWTKINHCDAPFWNYLGDCPSCVAKGLV